MLQSVSGPSIGGGQSVRPAGIMVLDPFGEVFDRIRALALPTTVWRVVDPRRVDYIARMGSDWYARASPEAMFELPRPDRPEPGHG